MGGRKSEVKVEGVDPDEVAEDVDKSWYSNTHNTLNYLSITHHTSHITHYGFLCNS
ncbi:nickel-dependent hydrogenase large subunit [Flexistipes sinusarabici]|uniref:nickel-dependent hydrogenase large subunit n=1 Tax=Flexistipes sinusarabici TaxID=2352 RepID=UPI0002F3D226|nr:nickel-dependent hydrogenase large subunit [Flexistipes sinusarabici]